MGQDWKHVFWTAYDNILYDQVNNASFDLVLINVQDSEEQIKNTLSLWYLNNTW